MDDDWSEDISGVGDSGADIALRDLLVLDEVKLTINHENEESLSAPITNNRSEELRYSMRVIHFGLLQRFLGDTGSELEAGKKL